MMGAQGTSGAGGRTATSGRLRVALVVALALAATTAFLAVGWVANAQPPRRRFVGFVALLQDEKEIGRVGRHLFPANAVALSEGRPEAPWIVVLRVTLNPQRDFSSPPSPDRRRRMRWAFSWCH